MKITILTLFPKMLEGFFSESVIGRAVRDGKVEVELVYLRDWGTGKWKKVDDTPYGGGAGMLLRPDVVIPAIEDLVTNYELRITNKIIKSKNQPKLKNKKSKIILLTPQGQVFSQQKAQRLADTNEDLLLICGHYEGFDERIRDYVDLEVSIGDYVLTGGELAAAVITDAVARLLPGVLGKEESHQKESLNETQNEKHQTQKFLEYPQYTRPGIYDGKKVPQVLLSGNHAKIEKWRQKEAKKRTKIRRPDLLS